MKHKMKKYVYFVGGEDNICGEMSADYGVFSTKKKAKKGIKILKKDKKNCENNDPAWEYYIIKFEIDKILGRNYHSNYE